MFKNILIAIQGEIAFCVMLTTCKFGIKTVALYSNVESEANRVEPADWIF